MHYLEKNIDWHLAEIADAYDELPFWGAPFGLLMFEHVPMLSSGRVLDVGFGTGFPLIPLAQRMGPAVHFEGIDPWENAVARAHRKLTAFGISHVQLQQGNAAQMDYPDADFDLVVSNIGINNFDEPEAVLAAVHRVLKPGATLCITTNPIGTFALFYDAFLSVLAENGLEQALMSLSQHIGGRSNRLQIADRLEAAGFSIAKVVERAHVMRYSSGTAFLNDGLIVMGFLPPWKAMLPQQIQRAVFTALETRLNTLAAENGELRMEVPMLYFEARKPS